MGLFKEDVESVYEEDIKPRLVEKDGSVHIIMVNSFDKWTNELFGCDSKYTIQMEKIISSMQKDGYEIVDIKFITANNEAFSSLMKGFHTLIMYK